MLKGSCNVADKAQTLTRFRVRPDPDRYRRRNAVVSCSSARRRLSSDLAVSLSSRTQVSELGAVEKPASLADRLRLGSLTEDRLSYKESFIIRCYEVGINKTATVETIANLLQLRLKFGKPLCFKDIRKKDMIFHISYIDMANKHPMVAFDGPNQFLGSKKLDVTMLKSVGFSTDGFATTPTMRKLHLIWVTARMHIEIYRYPTWCDLIEIETWCQTEGRIGTRRDFVLKDCANGEVIGRATSTFVMMNQDTRRLEKVSNEINEQYLIFCPKKLRLAFPEKNNKSLRKIPKLEDPAHYLKLGLVPRRADLDMNQHVNNVTYIGWVLESVPQHIIDTHELTSITLDYRRECQHDDVVDSLTTAESDGGLKPISAVNGTNGSLTESQDHMDSCQFLHLLRFSGNGADINRGRTEWRKKAPR